jgi:hypothetical protein
LSAVLAKPGAATPSLGYFKDNFNITKLISWNRLSTYPESAKIEDRPPHSPNLPYCNSNVTFFVHFKERY